MMMKTMCVCVRECVLMPGWFIKAKWLHLTDGQGEEFTGLYTFIGLQQSKLFLFFGSEVVPDESKSPLGDASACSVVHLDPHTLHMLYSVRYSISATIKV